VEPRGLRSVHGRLVRAARLRVLFKKLADLDETALVALIKETAEMVLVA
jgi:hypothetical protein